MFNKNYLLAGSWFKIKFKELFVRMIFQVVLMKDLNKVLYDILLKIEVKNEKKFMLNHQLILTYFNDLNDQKSNEYLEFNSYFVDFFNFCYELSLDNMVEDAINFRK